MVTYEHISPKRGSFSVAETIRLAIVTGSENGIGLAVTRKLLADGFNVVGVDLKMSGRIHGPNYSHYSADISDEKSIIEIFSDVQVKFERLDCLFNCAGITSLDTVEEISSESWDRMMSVNLKAVFFFCKEALKIMKRQGSGVIINVASNAGKSGGAAVGAHYAVSKAGVICLTKSLAMDAASYNVRINCVAPGPTSTQMTADWNKELKSTLSDKIPLGRFGEPDEVAEALLFLASEKAAYITGETLNVNGGLLMD
jgi:3-oxoacyl-[acyl-carrier protein] reductase